MRAFIFVLIIVGLVVGSAWAGLSQAQSVYQPQIDKLESALQYAHNAINHQSQQVRHWRNKAEQLEQRFTEVHPAKLRDFNGMDELHAFLADVTLQRKLFKPSEFVCSDYTLAMINLAAASECGYRMHIADITILCGNTIRGMHWANIAIVYRYDFTEPYKKQAYVVYIEPQTLAVAIWGRLHDDPADWTHKFYWFLPE